MGQILLLERSFAHLLQPTVGAADAVQIVPWKIQTIETEVYPATGDQ